MASGEVQPGAGNEPPPATEPETQQSNLSKKRKVALFLSYVGHGYQGMQRNPGAKTIEDDLFRAIHQAGGISEANADEKGFQKIHWTRAARTDKGVSAIGQVVSLMMVLHPPGIVDRINAILPEQIRVLGYKRVVKGFDSRKACDKRRYEYILPTWMFDPSVKGWMPPSGDKGNAEVADGGDLCNDDNRGNEQESNQGLDNIRDNDGIKSLSGWERGDPNFIFDQACIDRLTAILGQYEGTHNFHNFTVRTPARAPQARRYIIKFECQGVFQIKGQPWVKMVVIGQSFMLHQIRKMVGMALAEFRDVAPPGCIKYALGTSRDLILPMAPDLGLFLDECYYDAYNDRWGGHHGLLRLSEYSETITRFKQDRLYTSLADRDENDAVNGGWLRGLNELVFKFSSWLQSPDAATAGAAAASVLDKKSVDGVHKQDDMSNKRKREESPSQKLWNVKVSLNADYSD